MKSAVHVPILLAVIVFWNAEAAVILKRAPLSAFDSLGGTGLGKRSQSSSFWLEKRSSSLSNFDTLGGIGLGKRSNDEDVKRALSNFDTLGGIGLGKRSTWTPFIQEKRAISAFDSLGGIGLGKRSL